MSAALSLQAAPRATRRREDGSLYVVLALLVAGLGLARLVTGPWYHLYNPKDGVLLEGWPAEWEVLYYVQHLPTMLGNTSPAFGVAPVQYRVLPFLYLVGLLAAWTGSAYWSLAVADLMGWFLASVATYHVALRLGASRWAAALAAVLVAGSPLLISNMWTHVLHDAEFASFPVGLWAALAVMEHVRRPLPRAAALGVILLLLSVTYQYQWIVAPLLLVLLLWDARRVPRRMLRESPFVLAGALVVFLLGTALLKWALFAGGLSSVGEQATAVAQPADLALTKIASVSDALQLFFGAGLRVRMIGTAQLYSPWVCAASPAGFFFLPWRARLLALVACVGAISAWALYTPPWMAMAAYPLVYLGAGALCAAAGTLVTRALAGQIGRAPMAVVVLGRALSLALAVALLAQTNGDLLGNARYAHDFWAAYARVGSY